MKTRLLEKENRLIFTATLLLLALISFYIFYTQVFYYRFYNIPKSDLSDHVKLIELILRHKYHVPHAGFHYSTYFFSLVTTLSREYSAILLLTIFVLISFSVTFITLKLFLKGIYTEKTLLFIALALHLMTPVFLPIFNTTIFFGQGSPNIWHSPTFIMTKPFVLIVILLAVVILEDKRDGYQVKHIILIAILLTISVFYKPNFALAFIPALGIFTLVKHRMEFNKYVTSFFIVFPALILLGYQFISTYYLSDSTIGGTGDHLIFTFFGAWKVHTPSISLSVLRGIIFPALLFLFRRKEASKNDYLIISWIIYFVAFFEVAFLAEKESFNAFNFSNGYNFSLISLYTFSVIELLKWIKESDFTFCITDLKYRLLTVEQKKLFFSTIVFYWGIISGSIYLVRQVLGYGFS